MMTKEAAMAAAMTRVRIRSTGEYGYLGRESEGQVFHVALDGGTNLVDWPMSDIESLGEEEVGENDVIGRGR